MTCCKAGLYDVHTISGREIDVSGNWNVVLDYANCNLSPLEILDAK